MHTSPRKQYLLEEIFGLAVACPFDQGNPCNCPLHDLRKKGLRERYEWLQSLSEEALFDVLGFHQKWLEKKENFKAPAYAPQAFEATLQPMSSGE
jgi:hypothetical protein